LTKSVTEKITDERILNGYFERPGFWWLSSGNVNRVFLRKFSSVSKFLDQKRPYRGRWSGENASLFREDFLKVGGFDERFTSYGLEDGEFGARLWNAGIRPANVVYRSPIIHQWHPQPYRNPAPDNRNLTLYRNTIDHGLQSTEYGIRQHRSQPGACG
jgi:GT2 family glycosyltransferase